MNCPLNILEFVDVSDPSVMEQISRLRKERDVTHMPVFWQDRREGQHWALQAGYPDIQKVLAVPDQLKVMILLDQNHHVSDRLTKAVPSYFLEENSMRMVDRLNALEPRHYDHDYCFGFIAGVQDLVRIL